MAHVPVLLNSDQVAALVQLHPHTVRRFAHGLGDPDFPQPVRKIGRRMMWDEDDVIRYLSGDRHA